MKWSVVFIYALHMTQLTFRHLQVNANEYDNYAFTFEMASLSRASQEAAYPPSTKTTKDTPIQKTDTNISNTNDTFNEDYVTSKDNASDSNSIAESAQDGITTGIVWQTPNKHPPAM